MWRVWASKQNFAVSVGGRKNGWKVEMGTVCVRDVLLWSGKFRNGLRKGRREREGFERSYSATVTTTAQLQLKAVCCVCFDV